ncbi:ATP-binding cassette domain-containing protein [Candidatus Bathyarchaeota archaeon]|nr:ATP-binding cassette domain-containing protein [Candidatus Bathyarchaeota archaeon]
MPVVRLVNVKKSFGKIVAVDGVSLHIKNKEYFSLLGPSGCGKTTLLRLIAGLVQPDEGEIYIGQKLVNDVPPEDRNIGFVFQTFALFPHMDAWNNVIYGPRVKGFEMRKAETIGHEVLEMVKLHERLNAFPNELSGGMMQRIAVARALAAGAELLLLDEPLGHLDAKVRNELRYEIRRMTKDLGLTAVHVTHDQSEAMAISDRIAVLKKGKILQTGTPTELYLTPKNIFVAHFIGESNFLEGYVSKVSPEGSAIELRGEVKVQVGQKDFKKGERVVLAVRPETFTIAEGKREKENSVVGTIERTTFEGTNMRYEIRLENQDLVVVVKPSLTEEWFKVGRTVTVSFSAEKAHLFIYPESGLREELAVE